MDENNIYYNAFIAAALERLRPGFGAIVSYYPYQGGNVLKIEMKPNAPCKKETKGLSTNLVQALLNTKLFSPESCNGLSGKVVDGTLIYIVSVKDYVILKSNSESEWTADKAVADFSEIFTKVKEKYGR